MRLDIASFSSPGGRERNEDSVGAWIAQNGALLVVADGLGGHADGDRASSCVVETMRDAWESEKPEVRGPWLCEKLLEANERILAIQRERSAVLKSTAVMLAIDDGEAVWAHVGDSRLYFLRERELVHVTRDHSVAFKKYAAGEITRWEIGRDEDQSSLLRTLGSKERNEPELCPAPAALLPGDAFFLCSDGAWEFLHDQEILIDLLKAPDAQRWIELLLLRIMERVDGTNDNLSMIAVRCMKG